jgi:hypothetical protein
MSRFSHRLQAAATLPIKILVVVCVVGVAGCGNSDVSKVEAMKMDIDPSYTVGQAFDNRKVCDSVKSDVITDTPSRKLVEYRCLFKGVNEFAAPAASPATALGEILQWSLGTNGTPALAYAGFETTHENGQVDNQAMNANAAERVITQHTATTAMQYNARNIQAQYR